MLYRVTASALNLRDGPSETATRIARMARGDTVTVSGPAAGTPDWVQVSWNGRNGFCAIRFLEAVAAPPGAPNPSAYRVDRAIERLHPDIRQRVQTLLSDLAAEGLPFKLFEGFRTPERQAQLFAQGRTTPGGIVTKAEPWSSFHQYGLAADLVLFVDGAWSWGGPATSWTRMNALAATRGLTTLSWEKPHVQMAGADLAACRAGRFPPGGDESWYSAVMDAAARWRRNGGRPGGPDPSVAERPPLADAS